MGANSEHRPVLGEIALVFPGPTVEFPVKFTPEQRHRLGDLPEETVASLEQLCCMVRDMPVLRGENKRKPATPAQRERAVARLLKAVVSLQKSIAELPGSEAATITDLVGGKDLGQRLNDDLESLRRGAVAKLPVLQARKRTGPQELPFKSQFVELIETRLESAGLKAARSGRFQRIAEVCFEAARIHGGAESAIDQVTERRKLSKDCF